MPFKIGIRFDVQDFIRWTSALKRITKQTIIEAENLPRKCSIDYYQLVYRNIVSQKYAGGYPAYHPDYEKWKKKLGTRMDYWRLWDALVNSLGSFKVQSDEGETAYMGGISDTITFKGKPIAMYGRTVETGKFGPGKAVKPRPVFKPSALEYADKHWVSRFNDSVRKIKQSWR